MPQEINDPFLITFYITALRLSVATCVVLVFVRSRGPLLKFERRKLVPWDGFGLALACVFVAMTIASVFVSFLLTPAAKHGAIVKEMPTTSDFAANLGGWIILELLLVSAFLLLIVVYFKAKRQDLGLPANLRQFLHDVLIGVVAGVAALAPVFAIQVLSLHIMNMSETESGNPLIKDLARIGANAGILALATFATVVVAPICEEIAFRLLLQGWLEKRTAMHYRELLPSELPSESAAVPDVDSERPTDDVASSDLPSAGIARLAFTWRPIVTSAALLGLAHFGYGPDPISLFCLGLLLGYLYQRTHRLVPSIVAHAVFNSFTMVVLWRVIFFGAK